MEELQGRQLPYSLESEEAVLGSIFIDENVLIDISAILDEHDFYVSKHKLIYSTMVTLHNNSMMIDYLTIKETLEKKNQLENVGGLSYLIELSQKVPTSANAEYYARVVLEKSNLRKIIKVSTDLIKNVYDGEEESRILLDKAEQELINISESRYQDGFKHIKDVASENYETITLMASQKGDVTGVSTGFFELDKKTTGLHPDELIILAARPAVGKTAFALNIAQNVATKSNGVVAIFSLEMGAESLVNRMLCAEGLIDAGHLRTGNLDQDEWNRLAVAIGKLSEKQIFIDDTPGIKVSEIRAKTRKLKQREKRLDLIVIDYLQLIESSANRRENRQQEVSEISRQLKKLAKELSVPVIALSQLSRGVEQRTDKRPMLSDIRESGSIEQDADIVAFLYREDYYHREGSDEDYEENNIVEVIIEKNRSGARGTVELLFTKEYNKFSSIEHRYEQE